MKSSSRITAMLTVLAIAAAVLALPGAAGADDRDLLRATSGKPMIFVLFDTSGSMNWTPPCVDYPGTPGDPDDPPVLCEFECPTGDCYAPRQADDPASKMYQAREALYEVIAEVEDVDFGWATFNQDALRVNGKNWHYTPTTNGPTIDNYGPYPAVGDREVFGRTWNCGSGSGVGCSETNPADLNDSWERTRVQRYPKLGTNFTEDVNPIFVRRNGSSPVHRVYFEPTSGSPGDDTVSVEITVQRRSGIAQNWNHVSGSPRTITFRKVDEFISWDIRADRNPPEQGYFEQASAASATAGGTCNGWDPNTDSGGDSSGGINLRWPTVNDPDFGAPLARGDVIPWDWRDDNRGTILDILAPNRLLGEGTPDFGIARYFRDTPDGGRLRLRNNDVRTLIPTGSTPLAQMLGHFGDWYESWHPIARNEMGANEFSCRPRYVLLITDGDPTCPSTNNPLDPCPVAGNLLGDHNIRTFVVGFGLPGGDSNALTCIAEDGGTGEPYFPRTKEDLVAALREIVNRVSTDAASFASPSVSQQSINDDQKIFLPSFTPANDSAYWPGSLDAFLRPLPLDDDDRPDRDHENFLWDVRESTLLQVDPGDPIGPGQDQRRIFYSPYSRTPGGWAGGRRTLDPPPDPAADTGTPSVRYDFWRGLGMIGAEVPDNGLSEPEETTLYQQTDAILDRTLEAKHVVITLPNESTLEIDFVIGDFFHSTPLAIANPTDSHLFITDAGYDQDAECTAGDSNANHGYRCHFNRHQRRRKVLLAGSNDGMLHAFDAGVFRGSAAEGSYDDGTGHELWAYAPRGTLPTVRNLATGNQQDWGADGPPAAVDALIDPVFGAGGPNPDERRWRTVVVAGLREGGRSYYALDITQPDTIGSNLVPNVPGGTWNAGCYGAPLEAGSTPPAGCGPLPWPAPLWEFDDSLPRPGAPTDSPPGGQPVLLDEDGNGVGDLGDTWSTPALGRVLVCKAAATSCDPAHEDNVNPFDPDSGLEVRTVAIFGGGMDVDAKATPLSAQRGNWIYMVDVETGQAIYKRQLVGAVPADVAAIDSNGDGFLDRVYVPTLAGRLYRIDMVPLPAAGGYPRLSDVEVSTLECNAGTQTCPTVQRIVDSDPGTPSLATWDPYVVFDASADGVIRPLYIRPTVFFVAALREFAIGIGTGDREDLWSTGDAPGRFFVFADDRGLRPGEDPPLPLRPADLIPLEVGETTFTEAGTHNALLMPGDGYTGRGWYLELDEDERINQPAFALSGVLIFTSFLPNVDAQAGTCGLSGISRVFGVNTVNASGLMAAPVGEEPRQFVTVDNFVSNPFAESGGVSGGGDDEDEGDAMPEDVQRVFDGLQSLFPANCNFANYRVDVRMVSSDTSLEWPASVPVCIVQKNWKEF